MKYRARLLIALLSLLPILAYADDPIADNLKTKQQKLSYIIGTFIGKDLQAQGTELDIDALSRGIQDILTNQELKVDEETTEKLLAEFQKQREADFEELAVKNREKEKNFLTENASKEGVETHVTGLQYVVVEEGKGEPPNRSARVVIHYTGKLLDGTVFESTYEQGTPRRSSVSSLMPGLRIALTMMKEGAKWQLFVPADMAYRKQGKPPHVGPNETLIYDIELLSVGTHSTQPNTKQ